MDYSLVESFLIGRCGKSMRDAALTSYREYELLLEGYMNAEQERWERIRWQVFMEWTISPHLKRRPRTPQDVIKFPWEKDKVSGVQKAEPLTDAEIEQLSRIFGIDKNKISNG